MSKGKEVERKRGDSLLERFLPQGTQPQQSAEQLAETVAEELAEEIRDALVKTVHPGGPVKEALSEELIKRARSLAYSLALREIGSPENKAKSRGQDVEAIKEIGKWLVTITGVRGAPPIKREQGIKALEMHLSGMKWMDVTKEICDCGKSEHDHWCKERIRQETLELKKLLRKYEIGDVPPLNQDRSEMIKQGKLKQWETQKRRKKILP